MLKNRLIRSIWGQGLCLVLLVQSVATAPVRAHELLLPQPGARVALSPVQQPPLLRGLKVRPDNPLHLDFILDQGSASADNAHLLATESAKLVKYFLAGLTVPEKDLWVNLSPYEKDRIVPDSFGQTEMGRDLLAQDYLLKQITASLLYPEGETGRKFWAKVYAQAAQRLGTTTVPVSTFNKVWIVPEKAEVYENAKAGTAYVVESKLKVMLEQDYVATQRNRSGEGAQRIEPQDHPAGSHLAQTILRDVIIPIVDKEVNAGTNFAQLRQVYASLILAHWYKKKLKDSVLAAAYGDKGKIRGTEYTASVVPGGSVVNDPQVIYQRYLEAFKKGVYNYIKDDVDPLTRQAVPRKYFSGGVQIAPYLAHVMQTAPRIDPARLPRDGVAEVAVDLAMNAEHSASRAAPVQSYGNAPLRKRIERRLQDVMKRDYGVDSSVIQVRAAEFQPDRLDLRFFDVSNHGHERLLRSIDLEYDFTEHEMRRLSYGKQKDLPPGIRLDEYAMFRLSLMAAKEGDPEFNRVALSGWGDETRRIVDLFFEVYGVSLEWDKATEPRSLVVPGGLTEEFWGKLGGLVVPRPVESAQVKEAHQVVGAMIVQIAWAVAGRAPDSLDYERMGSALTLEAEMFNKMILRRFPGADPPTMALDLQTRLSKLAELQTVPPDQRYRVFASVLEFLAARWMAVADRLELTTPVDRPMLDLMAAVSARERLPGLAHAVLYKVSNILGERFAKRQPPQGIVAQRPGVDLLLGHRDAGGAFQRGILYYLLTDLLSAEGTPEADQIVPGTSVRRRDMLEWLIALVLMPALYEVCGMPPEESTQRFSLALSDPELLRNRSRIDALVARISAYRNEHWAGAGMVRPGDILAMLPAQIKQRLNNNPAPAFAYLAMNRGDVEEGANAWSFFDDRLRERIQLYLSQKILKDYGLDSSAVRVAVQAGNRPDKLQLRFVAIAPDGQVLPMFSMPMEYNFKEHRLTWLVYDGVREAPALPGLDKYAALRLALLAVKNIDPQFQDIALKGWQGRHRWFIDRFFEAYGVSLRWEKISGQTRLTAANGLPAVFWAKLNAEVVTRPAESPAVRMARDVIGRMVAQMEGIADVIRGEEADRDEVRQRLSQQAVDFDEMITKYVPFVDPEVMARDLPEALSKGVVAVQSLSREQWSSLYAQYLTFLADRWGEMSQGDVHAQAVDMPMSAFFAGVARRDRLEALGHVVVTRAAGMHAARRHWREGLVFPQRAGTGHTIFADMDLFLGYADRSKLPQKGILYFLLSDRLEIEGTPEADALVPGTRIRRRDLYDWLIAILTDHALYTTPTVKGREIDRRLGIVLEDLRNAPNAGKLGDIYARGQYSTDTSWSAAGLVSPKRIAAMPSAVAAAALSRRSLAGVAGYGQAVSDGAMIVSANGEAVEEFLKNAVRRPERDGLSLDAKKVFIREQMKEIERSTPPLVRTPINAAAVMSQIYMITPQQEGVLWRSLKENGYISDDGVIQRKFLDTDEKHMRVPEGVEARAVWMLLHGADERNVQENNVAHYMDAHQRLVEILDVIVNAAHDQKEELYKTLWEGRATLLPFSNNVSRLFGRNLSNLRLFLAGFSGALEQNPKQLREYMEKKLELYQAVTGYLHDGVFQFDSPVQRERYEVAVRTISHDQWNDLPMSVLNLVSSDNNPRVVALLQRLTLYGSSRKGKRYTDGELRSFQIALGQIAVYLKGLDDATKQRADYTSTVDLVEDLLSLMEGDVTGRSIQAVSLGGIISEALTMATETRGMGFRGKNISLTVAPDVERMMLNVDRRKMVTVMATLFKNSFQVWRERFPDGNPEDIHIQIAAVAGAPGQVAVQFEDNAGGIRAKELLMYPDASQPNRQAAFFMNTSRRKGDTGLGLAMVYHLINVHGGTVRFENVTDAADIRGARFIISLPGRVIAPARPMGQDQAMPAQDRPHETREKVLDWLVAAVETGRYAGALRNLKLSLDGWLVTDGRVTQEDVLTAVLNSSLDPSKIKRFLRDLFYKETFDRSRLFELYKLHAVIWRLKPEYGLFLADETRDHVLRSMEWNRGGPESYLAMAANANSHMLVDILYLVGQLEQGEAALAQRQSSLRAWLEQEMQTAGDQDRNKVLLLAFFMRIFDARFAREHLDSPLIQEAMEKELGVLHEELTSRGVSAEWVDGFLKEWGKSVGGEDAVLAQIGIEALRRLGQLSQMPVYGKLTRLRQALMRSEEAYQLELKKLLSGPAEEISRHGMLNVGDIIRIDRGSTASVYGVVVDEDGLGRPKTMYITLLDMAGEFTITEVGSNTFEITPTLGLNILIAGTFNVGKLHRIFAAGQATGASSPDTAMMSMEEKKQWVRDRVGQIRRLTGPLQRTPQSDGMFLADLTGKTPQRDGILLSSLKRSGYLKGGVLQPKFLNADQDSLEIPKHFSSREVWQALHMADRRNVERNNVVRYADSNQQFIELLKYILNVSDSHERQTLLDAFWNIRASLHDLATNGPYVFGHYYSAVPPLPAMIYDAKDQDKDKVLHEVAENFSRYNDVMAYPTDMELPFASSVERERYELALRVMAQSWNDIPARLGALLRLSPDPDAGNLLVRLYMYGQGRLSRTYSDGELRSLYAGLEKIAAYLQGLGEGEAARRDHSYQPTLDIVQDLLSIMKGDGNPGRIRVVQAGHLLEEAFEIARDASRLHGVRSGINYSVDPRVRDLFIKVDSRRMFVALVAAFQGLFHLWREQFPWRSPDGVQVNIAWDEARPMGFAIELMDQRPPDSSQPERQVAFMRGGDLRESDVGLGMDAAYQLITVQGGTIRLESAVKDGVVRGWRLDIGFPERFSASKSEIMDHLVQEVSIGHIEDVWKNFTTPGAVINVGDGETVSEEDVLRALLHADIDPVGVMQFFRKVVEEAFDLDRLLWLYKMYPLIWEERPELGLLMADSTVTHTVNGVLKWKGGQAPGPFKSNNSLAHAMVDIGYLRGQMEAAEEVFAGQGETLAAWLGKKLQSGSGEERTQVLQLVFFMRLFDPQFAHRHMDSAHIRHAIQDQSQELLRMWKGVLGSGWVEKFLQAWDPWVKAGAVGLPPVDNDEIERLWALQQSPAYPIVLRLMQAQRRSPNAYRDDVEKMRRSPAHRVVNSKQLKVGQFIRVGGNSTTAWFGFIADVQGEGEAVQYYLMMWDMSSEFVLRVINGPGAMALEIEEGFNAPFKGTHAVTDVYVVDLIDAAGPDQSMASKTPGGIDHSSRGKEDHSMHRLLAQMKGGNYAALFPYFATSERSLVAHDGRVVTQEELLKAVMALDLDRDLVKKLMSAVFSSLFDVSRLSKLYPLARVIWQDAPDIGLYLADRTVNHLLEYLEWKRGAPGKFLKNPGDSNAHALVDSFFLIGQLEQAEQALRAKGTNLRAWLETALRSEDPQVRGRALRLAAYTRIFDRDFARQHLDNGLIRRALQQDRNILKSQLHAKNLDFDWLDQFLDGWTDSLEGTETSILQGGNETVRLLWALQGTRGWKVVKRLNGALLRSAEDYEQELAALAASPDEELGIDGQLNVGDIIRLEGGLAIVADKETGEGNKGTYYVMLLDFSSERTITVDDKGFVQAKMVEDMSGAPLRLVDIRRIRLPDTAMPWQTTPLQQHNPRHFAYVVAMGSGSPSGLYSSASLVWRDGDSDFLKTYLGQRIGRILNVPAANIDGILAHMSDDLAVDEHANLPAGIYANSSRGIADFFAAHQRANPKNVLYRREREGQLPSVTPQQLIEASQSGAPDRYASNNEIIFRNSGVAVEGVILIAEGDFEMTLRDLQSHAYDDIRRDIKNGMSVVILGGQGIDVEAAWRAFSTVFPDAHTLRGATGASSLDTAMMSLDEKKQWVRDRVGQIRRLTGPLQRNPQTVDALLSVLKGRTPERDRIIMKSLEEYGYLSGGIIQQKFQDLGGASFELSGDFSSREVWQALHMADRKDVERNNVVRYADANQRFIELLRYILSVPDSQERQALFDELWNIRSSLHRLAADGSYVLGSYYSVVPQLPAMIYDAKDQEKDKVLHEVAENFSRYNDVMAYPTDMELPFASSLERERYELALRVMAQSWNDIPARLGALLRLSPDPDAANLLVRLYMYGQGRLSRTYSDGELRSFYAGLEKIAAYLQGLGEEDPARRERSYRSTLDIVQDLLSLMKGDNDPSRKRVVQANHLLEEALEIARNASGFHNMREGVAYSVDPRVQGMFINVDSRRMVVAFVAAFQTLFDLWRRQFPLRNYGGLRVNVAWNEARPMGFSIELTDQVPVAVDLNDMGFPDSSQPERQAVFMRAEESREEDIGLGRDAAYQLITVQGGTIRLKSAVKEGVVRGWRLDIGFPHNILASKSEIVDHLVQEISLGRIDDVWRQLTTSGAGINVGDGETVSEEDVLRALLRSHMEPTHAMQFFRKVVEKPFDLDRLLWLYKMYPLIWEKRPELGLLMADSTVTHTAMPVLKWTRGQDPTPFEPYSSLAHAVLDIIYLRGQLETAEEVFAGQGETLAAWLEKKLQPDSAKRDRTRVLQLVFFMRLFDPQFAREYLDSANLRTAVRESGEELERAWQDRVGNGSIKAFLKAWDTWVESGAVGLPAVDNDEIKRLWALQQSPAYPIVIRLMQAQRRSPEEYRTEEQLLRSDAATEMDPANLTVGQRIRVSVDGEDDVDAFIADHQVLRGNHYYYCLLISKLSGESILHVSDSAKQPKVAIWGVFMSPFDRPRTVTRVGLVAAPGAARADQSMSSKTPGGIDLSASGRVSATRQDSPQGFQFKSDAALAARLRVATGLTPVVVRITPIRNLAGYLGIAPSGAPPG